MELNDGDYVVDMSVIKQDCEVITMTEKGYGKRSDLSDYRLQSRAGKGVKAGVFNAKTGKLASLKLISLAEDVMIITANGTIIRVASSDISKIGRNTQGVRVMRTDENTEVMKIAITPKSEDDETADDEGPISGIKGVAPEAGENVQGQVESNLVENVAEQDSQE
jgi:DNA gyrase subunit A